MYTPKSRVQLPEGTESVPRKNYSPSFTPSRFGFLGNGIQTGRFSGKAATMFHGQFVVFRSPRFMLMLRTQPSEGVSVNSSHDSVLQMCATVRAILKLVLGNLPFIGVLNVHLYPAFKVDAARAANKFVTRCRFLIIVPGHRPQCFRVNRRKARNHLCSKFKASAFPFVKAVFGFDAASLSNQLTLRGLCVNQSYLIHFCLSPIPPRRAAVC